MNKHAKWLRDRVTAVAVAGAMALGIGSGGCAGTNWKAVAAVGAGVAAAGMAATATAVAVENSNGSLAHPNDHKLTFPLLAGVGAAGCGVGAVVLGVQASKEPDPKIEAEQSATLSACDLKYKLSHGAPLPQSCCEAATEFGKLKPAYKHFRCEAPTERNISGM